MNFARLSFLASSFGLAIFFSTSPIQAQMGGGIEEAYHIDGAQPFEYLGSYASAAGDIDGDGVNDFILSNPFTILGGQYNTGEASVYSGASGTLLFHFDGNAQLQLFGISTNGLGDINGDGFGDFIIGAPQSDFGAGNSSGSAIIYSGFDGSILYQYFGQSTSDKLGQAVANAGDVDADGTNDFIIGAFQASPNGLSLGGSAYVYSGATGLVLYQFDSTRANASFGNSVDSAGDINHDGFDDVIIGALADKPMYSNLAGSVFVYSGFDGSLLFHFLGEGISHYLGSTVVGGEDVNSDGTPDFLIGASGWSNGFRAYQGATYVYSGDDGSLLYFYSGNSRNAKLGRVVSFAGDIDRDGHADFFLGAPDTNLRGVDRSGTGMIYSGATGALLHRFQGEVLYESMGSSFANLGDTTGDGYSNFLIAATGRNQRAGSAAVLSFDPYLTTSAYRLSRTTGGTVTINIDFPDSEAGAKYGLLLSRTGAESSGFRGGTIPLVQDALFQQVASGWTPPFMSNNFGTLDANGNATATFTLLPNSPPSLIDTRRWFSAVTLVPGSQDMSEASIAVPLKIIP